MISKALAGEVMFGVVSVIGANIMGDAGSILTEPQKLGLVVAIIGITMSGVFLGWIIRSAQPDLKTKQENDIISNNRNPQ